LTASPAELHVSICAGLCCGRRFGATLAWPYLTVAAGVLLVTQLTSFIPARRAVNLDVQKTLASA
jgi:hypothetical protein